MAATRCLAAGLASVTSVVGRFRAQVGNKCGTNGLVMDRAIQKSSHYSAIALDQHMCKTDPDQVPVNTQLAYADCSFKMMCPSGNSVGTQSKAP